MTTYAWPSSIVVSSWDLLQSHNNVVFTSVLNGESQTASLPGARWGWAVGFRQESMAVRAVTEAWLARLSGMQHRALLYDLARPTPTGTISGTITASAAAIFATSIVLNGMSNGQTLKAGDWFSVMLSTGVTQLLMCVLDATASGTSMTVEFRHPLRAAVSASAAVVISQPTGYYIMKQPEFGVPRAGANKAPAFTIEFREVFVP
jgi:hypothetical protein